MKTIPPLAIQAGRKRQQQRAVLVLKGFTEDTKEPMTEAPAATDLSHIQPPAELHIKSIAARLQVGVRDLASAAGIGPTTWHQIISLNQWPKRMHVNRAAVAERLKQAGATPAELDQLWSPVSKVVPPERLKTASRKQAANDQSPDTDTPPETDMLMGKQTLSMTARKAFSLFTNPFDGDVASEADMFVSSEIRFVREAIWQGAINGSFLAVMGESGAGKTTILADLKDRAAKSSRPIIMIEPSVLGMGDNDRIAKTIKSNDILAALVATLDPITTIKQTVEARTRQSMKLLEDSLSAGNSHMLVIEEAHDLPIVTLKHLKRLHERARIGRRSALGILLIAHPELRNKISERRHDVREVYQRCEMLDLRPLDSELYAYLQHKAKAAGQDLAKLITPEGVEAIRARLTVERRENLGKALRPVSLVYPLAVQNVITAALNLAAELGATIVDADIVKEL